jgi:hypothetical protein
VEEIGSVAYQHSISVPLVAPPLKRSTVVFVATLTMRYVPGWVLNGRIAEPVELGALGGGVDVEEAVEVWEEVEAVEDDEDAVDIEVVEDVVAEDVEVKESDDVEEDIEDSEDWDDFEAETTSMMKSKLMLRKVSHLQKKRSQNSWTVAAAAAPAVGA